MLFSTFFKQRLGFTMVELLVVISIIGILATAVLAALNPVEQLRKGRDTSRKADAATILGALDRFQATFGCYPWQWSATTNACVATTITALNPSGTGQVITPASFTTSGNALYEIQQKDELKSQFSERSTVTNSEMWLSVNASGQASVCFAPESTSARGGGLGPIKNALNITPATNTCTAVYQKISAATDSCAVCVPQ